MAGKLVFTLEQYQEAAVKYRKELLMLPIFGSMDTLKHMTGRPGIRYKERVGTMDFDAQFGPYKPQRRSNNNLKLDFRTLETFLGSVIADFEPNQAIQTLLGEGPTKGDGQMQTPTAKHVLAFMAKSLSFHLNEALWAGVRNANGDTTMDLFDGFDTITQKEIEAENISVAKGNYLKLTEKITKANACDVLKEILFSLDPHLRAQQLNLYCSQELVDMYNESYQLTHGGLPYNTRYSQNAVEGSEGRLVMVPLANKFGSNFIHIAPKGNMLYGYDTMSDETSILVKEYQPFILSFIATMFFGVQFETLDKRRFKTIELADETPAAETPAPENPTPETPANNAGGEGTGSNAGGEGGQGGEGGEGHE